MVSCGSFSCEQERKFISEEWNNNVARHGKHNKSQISDFSDHLPVKHQWDMVSDGGLNVTAAQKQGPSVARRHSKGIGTHRPGQKNKVVLKGLLRSNMKGCVILKCDKNGGVPSHWGTFKSCEIRPFSILKPWSWGSPFQENLSIWVYSNLTWIIHHSRDWGRLIVDLHDLALRLNETTACNYFIRDLSPGFPGRLQLPSGKLT